MSFLKIKHFKCFQTYSSDRTPTSVYTEIQLTALIGQNYVNKDSCLIDKNGGK